MQLEWMIFCSFLDFILIVYPVTHGEAYTHNLIRPKKIKGLFALLVWKLGGSVSWFFFLLIWTQKKCSIIHVCSFLGIQSPRIGLILVLEGIEFHLVKLPFLGQLLHTLTFCSNSFVWKCKIDNQKKKKKSQPLFSNIWVGRKRANKHLFLRPYEMCTICQARGVVSIPNHSKGTLFASKMGGGIK